MDEILSAKAPWSLGGLNATLRCEQLSGTISVASPQSGLQSILVGGQSLAGELLCVYGLDASADRTAAKGRERLWPLDVSDAYIRGHDLIATYRPTDDWPYAPQIYWRAGEPGTAATGVPSLRLVVSMQTHLLDTWPRIGIWSALRSEELVHFSADANQPWPPDKLAGSATFEPSQAPTCIVRRLQGLSISYIEIMPASDFRRVRLEHTASGEARAEWELFSEFLEKGVICKARMQSAFVPRAKDLDIAAALCRQIEQLELPLTT
jgi:hypothetical protein